VTPTPTIELVPLPVPAIAALAAGDLATANAHAPVPLDEWFLGAEIRHVWAIRHRQLQVRPDDADWITRVIWDAEQRRAVGQAGFHGPPDAHGMVELGYSVAPDFRRRGYARAAFADLLARARREPTVRVLRATVSPGNVASENLVAAYGLVRVGEQWDDEDGLEIVYELAVDEPAVDERDGGVAP
jgi:RimJ/RimL family protein N-acetyltransferase